MENRQLIHGAYRAKVMCAADATYILMTEEGMTLRDALLLLADPAPLFLED